MQKEGKTKQIEKDRNKDAKGSERTRTNYKKKIDFYERKICELQRELEKLQRKFECCPNCRYNMIEGCF